MGGILIREFNPHHVPAGSPEGGQFTSGDGGGGESSAKPSGFKPYAVATRLAQEYMRSQGREYTPATPLSTLDPVRMAEVANAYDQMKHAPQDPDVAAAYKAFAEETLAQYRVLIANGLKVEPAPAGAEPYRGAADMARDVRLNNHMFYFPTTSGFGSSTFDASDNPLLADSGLKDSSGRKMLINDIFRVTHDFFGHAMPGNTFRPLGEENAWRSHTRMYSATAGKAVASEARGQNAFVYFGPHGAANRAAKSGADIIFADQKTGIMGAEGLKEARDRSQQRKGRIPGGILHPHHWEPPGPDETVVHEADERNSMTEREMVLEETARILRRLPRPLKKKRRAPADVTLREGLSVRDSQILQEGLAHEERFLEEQVSSGSVSPDYGMIPGYGWVATSTPNVLNHPKLTGHRIMTDGNGNWRHHDAAGRIVRRGQGQQSLSEYARTIDIGDLGNANAAESLDQVLRRVRGESPRPTVEAARLMEAIRTREVGRTSGTSGEDLHSRLRKAVTK